MNTLAEETASETNTSDDGGSDGLAARPRAVGAVRLEPLLEGVPRAATERADHAEPSDRGQRPPIVFFQPPPHSRMDRGGWRRPSAPSIFHHIESALSRRLSGTPPATVAPTPVSRSSSPSPPPLAPALRRPSPATATSNAVALRRPSAVVLVTPDEERRLMEVHHDPPDRGGSVNSFSPLTPEDEYLTVTPKFDDTITVYLSAMYAKLLFTLGIAFPILETISADGKYYQGFYLYLYVGTFFFLAFMYGNVLKTRAVIFVVNTYRRKGSQPRPSMVSINSSHIAGLHSHGHAAGHHKMYGSFYLRLGAIAFGIGSMVYSGLEFGQYFELNPDCRRATQALTPAARMVLTLVQIQFIFMNNREIDMLRHKVVAQLGLMHMIATNLCEWLTVIIEEAKHEIEHLHHEDHVANASLAGGHGGAHHQRAPRSPAGPAGPCVAPDVDVLSTLVRDASPFLFPCTIEYSLICAVVLFEMWKNAHRQHGQQQHRDHAERHGVGILDPHGRSANHLSVDCTKAHKGLFAGIVVVVLTIISLILFFVLNEAPGFDEQGMLVVSICELSLYVVTLLAVLIAFYQTRCLKYLNKTGGLGLDNTLLVMAQTGVFLYNLFAVLAYGAANKQPRILVSELMALVQTICQTIFVLDTTRRRCSSPREYRRKPGRQMVTFLLVSNMAMWIVNTLEKSRARSRPILLEFYGDWPWTLIVHISMPLAIFYRFHSTICLFEIWKGCYKYKHVASDSSRAAHGGHGAHGAVGLRKHADSERSGS